MGEEGKQSGGKREQEEDGEGNKTGGNKEERDIFFFATLYELWYFNPPLSNTDPH